jgi:putative sterol carrier protein
MAGRRIAPDTPGTNITRQGSVIMRTSLVASALLLAAGSVQSAEPVMMSADWGPAACAAWNADPVLTRELAASDWIRNDKGRGFKVMQLYREDCGDQPTVELRVALKDGKATCVYGGAVQTTKLESAADYVMFAETKRWQEMGRGEYGPMKAMSFGRLGFKGPKMEAMGNMGPFGNFLLLVGKVPADAKSCPK